MLIAGRASQLRGRRTSGPASAFEWRRPLGRRWRRLGLGLGVGGRAALQGRVILTPAGMTDHANKVGANPKWPVMRALGLGPERRNGEQRHQRGARICSGVTLASERGGEAAPREQARGGRGGSRGFPGRRSPGPIARDDGPRATCTHVTTWRESRRENDPRAGPLVMLSRKKAYAFSRHDHKKMQ